MMQGSKHEVLLVTSNGINHNSELAAQAADEPNISASETTAPVEHVNRFLFCTLVLSVARQIKARREQGGERASLLVVMRDVFQTYVQASGVENVSIEATAPEMKLPDLARLQEDAFSGEIQRRLQDYFRQSCAQQREAQRLDIESLILAQEAKRKRQITKRG